MRHPEYAAAIPLFPVLILAFASCLGHMGVMMIEEVEPTGRITATMERIVRPLSGLSYLSAGRGNAERMLGELGYVESVSFSYYSGRLVMDAHFREGGILVLSDASASLVFPDGSMEVALEDAGGLLAHYDALAVDESVMEFYKLFGFDYGALAEQIRQGHAMRVSSTRCAIDDKVYGTDGMKLFLS